MELRIAFAGVLRTLRILRKARYTDLSDALSRRKISALENGDVSVTLERFDEIANSLDLDGVAMHALAIATSSGQSYQDVLMRANAQLQALESEGALKTLDTQFDVEGKLVERSRGKPLNLANEQAVLDLKAKGLSQLEVAEYLKLPLTSVRRYWAKE
ncbi:MULTISPECIES: helix-turn-helix transcriptional regulator [Pseudomonas]|uniref:helix-turn-helix transcriptional regulator n=1 Tax=Pseudomonas TaxID=286 RepID=UPI0018D625B4|nr:helix-turn-helix transcriptional regulator [Pseudomonas asiatica]MBH3379628.1 helix-turn-helix transcriptional regulator [Pseudomonas asiatica]